MSAPSDKIMSRAREWRDFATISPSHEAEFQSRLRLALDGPVSFEEAMMLAQAALLMAGEDAALDAFVMWYRSVAQKLTLIAYDVAHREAVA